jgi:glycosyltransferase involved in cell wall biosynthesis
MADSKGVFGLVKEFARLDKSVKKKWILLLYGQGENRKKYKRFVNENNLESRVKFAKESGFLDLPKYLAVSDAAIDPKQNSTEGSAKLINYMAAGLPVICFENTFNKNRLGKKGFYVKKMDDLGKILAKNNLKPQEYDLEKESQEAEVKKLLNVYKKILKNKQ